MTGEWRLLYRRQPPFPYQTKLETDARAQCHYYDYDLLLDGSYVEKSYFYPSTHTLSVFEGSIALFSLSMGNGHMPTLVQQRQQLVACFVFR